MSKMMGRLALLGFVGMFAAAACDDNPLASDRDKVTRFSTNPSFANVKVAGQTVVTAIPLNRNNEPTGDPVTGTACDAKVTVAADTTRSAFEPPERFVVKGVTAGQSCINVSAGGVQATVTVNVVP
jgi:hypothetical protein